MGGGTEKVEGTNLADTGENATEKQGVFVVSNFYVPVVTGGILRTEKIVRGLSESMDAEVLTIKNYWDSGLVVDENFKGPEKAIVHRTYSPDLYVFLNLFTKLLKGASAMKEDSSLRHRGLSRTYYWFTPDPYLPWMITALPKALQIALSKRTRILLSTYPSPVSLFIGCLLKKLTGKFFYVDFQDPGFTAPKGVREVQPTRLHLWLNLLLEGKCLESADLITVVSRQMKDDLLAAHKKVKPEKVEVLPQIIDCGLSDSITPAKQEKFTITFTGALGPYQEIKKLVAAANKLVDEGKVKRAALQIVVAGPKNEAMLDEAGKADKNGLLKYVGTVPYSESISLMKGSDVLYVSMTFNEENRPALPTKTFEYMAAGKSILAFAPAGELTELVKNKKIGLAVDVDDTEELAKALLVLYSNEKIRAIVSKNALEAAKEFDYRNVVANKIIPWINSKNISR